MELRATAHHLGDIVAAGNNQQGGEDASSADSSMVSFTDYGKRRGMMGRSGWGDASQEEWGVEYAWVAQGGASRHLVPTFVERMPQAICTNFLRVRNLECCLMEALFSQKLVCSRQDHSLL